MVDLEATFEKYDDDFLRFERVENKLHGRPDVCAFLLLDKLVPGTSDVVDAAQHDEISLSIDCERLAEMATEDDIMTLVRCGVRYDSDYESLAMFV